MIIGKKHIKLGERKKLLFIHIEKTRARGKFFKTKNDKQSEIAKIFQEVLKRTSNKEICCKLDYNEHLQNT